MAHHIRTIWSNCSTSVQNEFVEFIDRFYPRIKLMFYPDLLRRGQKTKDAKPCGSLTAEVEVEISGRGSSRKHIRQSNRVCFRLFVNIYVLKTYSI